MINEQQFYEGTSGARGSIVTDPNDLPRFISEDTIALRNSSGLDHTSRTAEFWSAISYSGAVASVTVANAWTEIADIVGKGFLGNVVASHGNFAGSKTIGIRLTVDGVVWEWMATVDSGIFNSATLVAGSLSPVAGGDDGWFPAANRLTDTADPMPKPGGGRVLTGLLPTSFLISAGAPVLAFRESLKVEVRNNRIGATGEGQKAGCTYVRR